MRTVCGIGRWVHRLVTGDGPPGPALEAVPMPRGRPLLTDALGEQRRRGALLDQVDGTTCGSVVLVALAAWADPDELDRLEAEDPGPGAGGMRPGFGARFDARQRRVHRETNRLWPRALGTTPWAMTRWLRRNTPGAGPYRVRLVDDVSAADVEDTLAAVAAALAAGYPVPLLVGGVVPRHYCLALAAASDGSWRTYEPTSAQVKSLDPALVGRRALAPVLGFDRLHAVLLPGRRPRPGQENRDVPDS
jgi:hypothetical protein